MHTPRTRGSRCSVWMNTAEAGDKAHAALAAADSFAHMYTIHSKIHSVRIGAAEAHAALATATGFACSIEQSTCSLTRAGALHACSAGGAHLVAVGSIGSATDAWACRRSMLLRAAAAAQGPVLRGARPAGRGELRGGGGAGDGRVAARAAAGLPRKRPRRRVALPREGQRALCACAAGVAGGGGS